MKKLLSEYQIRFQLLRQSPLFEAMKPVSTYNSGGLTAKMWILPDGEVHSLGQQHFQWIRDPANKSKIAKFGLDPTTLPNDDDVVRTVVIKKGFFRVNYEKRASNLIIEGVRSKLSKKVKDAIFIIAMENLNDIDRISVTMFDDDVSKVVVRRNVEIFNYREDEEKLDAVDRILS